MKHIYVGLGLVLFTVPAWAYLDPGSGNALVYLLVSLAGALVYFVKNAFYKIQGFFVKGASVESAPKTDQSTDIAIFSEGRTYWYTWKPIVEELMARKIHFQYLSMDVRDPGLTIDSPYMHSRYQGEGSAGFARVSRTRAKFMLSTTPNIGCEGYPLPRPKAVEKLVHISHTVGDISYLKRGSLDHYDVDLDIAPWCEARMRKLEELRRLPKKEFVACGLCYLDELAKHIEKSHEFKAPGTVLFAPSWGAKNSLKIHGTQVLFDLLEAGFHVILRPHPQSEFFDQALYEPLLKKLSRFENFELDKAIGAVDSMNRADILISDSSSIRFDFALLTGRAVVTLLVPTSDLSSFEAGALGGPWETDVVPRLGVVLKPGESYDLVREVKALIKTPPAGIGKLYDELVVNHGKAGAAVVDWLERAVKSEE